MVTLDPLITFKNITTVVYTKNNTPQLIVAGPGITVEINKLDQLIITHGTPKIDAIINCFFVSLTAYTPVRRIIVVNKLSRAEE